MQDIDSSGGGNPSPNFVDYDWDNPASEFTDEQIQYADMPRKFLSHEELTRARQIEWISYNRNIETCSYSFIPGLRGARSTKGFAQDAVYVKRFSPLGFTRMMDLFLSHVPADFPKVGSGGNTPLYRVTLPNGDRFYPFEFFGDLDAWRKRLRESAEFHKTQLAKWDRATFTVADGSRFRFGELSVELPESKRQAKSW